MLFAVAAILLLQTLAVNASLFSHKYPWNDIEALCAGKATEITSFSQLVKVRDTVAMGSSCPEKTKEAIFSLTKVFARGRWDLCSEESVEMLKQFYATYLDTSALDDDAPYEAGIPKSLKRLALAYGMQMNNDCKKNMLKVLVEESHYQLLSEDDFKPFEFLINEESSIVRLLSSTSEPGEVYLPGDLAFYFVKRSQEKLFLQSAAGEQIKKLQSACEHRFRPLYEPLMMPLVKLANLGFNYKDESFKSCTAPDCRPEITRQIKRWSALIFVCEAMESIRIVEDPTESKEQVSGNKLVRILTKEEAAQMGWGSRPEVGHDKSEADHLAFVPSYVAFERDLILDQSNKRLIKAIKSLKTHRDEEELIERRLVRRSMLLLKSEIKSKGVCFMLSSAWKSLLKRRTKSTGAGAQIAKKLEALMELQNGSSHLDGAVSSSDIDWKLQFSIFFFFSMIVAIAVGGAVLASLAG